MATGLVKTRKADAQDPEENPRGGGLLLRVSLFLRMDAIWLITRSLAVGAVVRRMPLEDQRRVYVVDGARVSVLAGVSEVSGCCGEWEGERW